MASEPHKSVKLINFHVVNPSINAVDSFEHKGNSMQVLLCRRTLEHFSLYDRQVTSLDRKHQRVVNYDVLDMLNVDKLLLGLPCCHFLSVRNELSWSDVAHSAIIMRINARIEDFHLVSRVLVRLHLVTLSV